MPLLQQRLCVRCANAPLDYETCGKRAGPLTSSGTKDHVLYTKRAICKWIGFMNNECHEIYSDPGICGHSLGSEDWKLAGRPVVNLALRHAHGCWAGYSTLRTVFDMLA